VRVPRDSKELIPATISWVNVSAEFRTRVYSYFFSMGLEETVLPPFRDPRQNVARRQRSLLCLQNNNMNNNNDKTFRTGKNETINSPSQVKPQSCNAPAEPEFR
jgi:hypothetical protein